MRLLPEFCSILTQKSKVHFFPASFSKSTDFWVGIFCEAPNGSLSVGLFLPRIEALHKTWSAQTTVSSAAPKSKGGTGPGTCPDDPKLSLCVLNDLGLLGSDFGCGFGMKFLKRPKIHSIGDFFCSPYFFLCFFFFFGFMKILRALWLCQKFLEASV